MARTPRWPSLNQRGTGMTALSSGVCPSWIKCWRRNCGLSRSPGEPEGDNHSALRRCAFVSQSALSSAKWVSLTPGQRDNGVWGGGVPTQRQRQTLSKEEPAVGILGKGVEYCEKPSAEWIPSPRLDFCFCAETQRRLRSGARPETFRPRFERLLAPANVEQVRKWGERRGGDGCRPEGRMLAGAGGECWLRLSWRIFFGGVQGGPVRSGGCPPPPPPPASAPPPLYKGRTSI